MVTRDNRDLLVKMEGMVKLVVMVNQVQTEQSVCLILMRNNVKNLHNSDDMDTAKSCFIVMELNDEQFHFCFINEILMLATSIV